MSSNVYVKNPIAVEAFCINYDKIPPSVTSDVLATWPEWLRKAFDKSEDEKGSMFVHANGRFVIQTLEGLMEVSEGDYIIKGVRGEIYPCKGDIFEETYSPVITDKFSDVFVANAEEISSAEPLPLSPDNEGLYTVQRHNNFSVVFPFVGEESSYFPNYTPVLEMAVEEVSHLIKNWNPTTKKFDVEDVVFTFKDFIGANTSKALLAWVKEFESDSTKRVNIALIQHSSDGAQERKWGLFGCFPITFVGGYCNSESYDKSILSLNFSVSNFDLLSEDGSFPDYEIK